MKKSANKSVLNFIIFIISFFSLSNCLSAQNGKGKSYFDEKGFLAFTNTAIYYRQETDTANYFRSFYVANNMKYFEGKIISANDTLDNKNSYAGLCSWYYPNGMKKKQCLFNETGILNGFFEEFFEEGKVFKQIVYENGLIKNCRYIEYSIGGMAINVFEENFANNLNNWVLSKSESMTSKIKLGGLELVNKTKDDFIISISHKIDSSNFSIEASLNSSYIFTGCQTGLVFNYRDKRNYNYFYVSQFRYFIGEVKNGVDKRCVDNYFSFDLKANTWNAIKVVRLNDGFYYYINNKLQIITALGTSVGQSIGFLVNNGLAFFDNLIIKQFSEKAINPIIINDLFVEFDGKTNPIRSKNSGIMLSNNGYVLTSLADIENINGIIVEAVVNDSIKVFDAEIYLKNVAQNFAILKIKNIKRAIFSKPVFSYSYLKSIETEKKFVAKYLSINSNNKQFEVKTLIGDINEVSPHDHEKKGVADSHLCIGSPIFDKSGNILGVLGKVNDQYKIEIVNMQLVMGIYFNCFENNQIIRKPKNDPLNIEKNIFKNLVSIKTF